MLEYFNNIHQTGSRYYGNYHNESDYDYVVFIDDPDLDRQTTLIKIADIIAEAEGLEVFSDVDIDTYTLVNATGDNIYILTDEFNYPFGEEYVFTLHKHNNTTEIHLIVTKQRNIYNNWVYLSNLFKANVEHLNEINHKLLFNILRKYLNESTDIPPNEAFLLLKNTLTNFP